MGSGSTKTVNALQSFVAAVAMALLLAGCGGGGGSSGGTSGGSGGGGTPPPSVTLVSISVTPSFPASLPKGLTQQFTATGYYSNGSTQNLTASVAWSSTAGTVATVNASGLATGVGVGTTNINASASGVSSISVALTVSPAVLQSIAITPGNPSVVAGLTKQLAATGSYSDGTTQNLTSTVAWTSSNTPVATMGVSGLVMGVSAGTSTISATTTSGTIVSGSTTLTVANYIVSGTLSLLPGGDSVVLQNNGVDNLTLTANGPFIFNTPLASGTAYNVSVLTQPVAPAHTCYVVDGSGTITNAYITSVQVVCGMAVSTLAGSITSGSANGVGTASTFYWPASVAADTAGNVYVADMANNLIRKITPAGVVSTLAGSGAAGAANGTGAAATFNAPQGITVDTAGNVYVADTNNNLIRKITPTGVVSTFAGAGFGCTNGSAASATFSSPVGVAVDSSGNVYVADTSNQVIRKISAGVVSTLAGACTISGSANGTGAAASFSNPTGITVDSVGNVYVADYFNNLIRKITPAGAVSTLAGSGAFGSADGTGTAASFSRPNAVSVDSAGNVYVADTGNLLIRKITSGGVVTTMAGSPSTSMAGLAKNGPALSATFWTPAGIAVDTAGNWYVADQGNNMIRKIMP